MSNWKLSDALRLLNQCFNKPFTVKVTRYEAFISARAEVLVEQDGENVSLPLQLGFYCARALEMSKIYMGLRFIGAFESSDGYVFIHTSPAMDYRLKEILGVEKLEGKEDLKKWVKARKVNEVIDIFIKAGIPAARVNLVDQVVEDPQVKERGMIISMEHPTAGTVRVPKFPIVFSNISPSDVKPAPLLGQRNGEVYSQLLGLNSNEIINLKKVELYKIFSPF